MGPLSSSSSKSINGGGSWWLLLRKVAAVWPSSLLHSFPKESARSRANGLCVQAVAIPDAEVDEEAGARGGRE